jgi:tagatose-1,6-bisphosphate aldolase non-catalytic subunit AgaZ/GatZ
MSLGPVDYEVGTEEVHGGLADYGNFDRFLTLLRAGLEVAGLAHTWPCFIVGKVGTDLHTTTFDTETARRLHDRVSLLGSLIKGHYTDWVANPADYPATGMGAANVGPEFTATELEALRELCVLEKQLRKAQLAPSRFMETLQLAVVESNRWRKWLSADELEAEFEELEPSRREWLVATGARYVWTDPRVVAARARLYASVASLVPDPASFVVDRIVASMQRYVDAFNLKGSLDLLSG